ncbi:HNH endonuclease signature motif containing protein [Streptomyces rochei]|uniref:HNH endonuclease signature motif containing protein n=1 Tax=Streptomyces rochei TaxID=1928 RepID=UPI0036A2033D
MKTARERFWTRVDKHGPIPLVRGVNGRCWVWIGATNRDGYGRFSDRRRGFLAHRWAYLHTVGAIPAGLELDHLCRRRECVRPDHLDAVTHAENVSRGRAGVNHAVKTHCPAGHVYDEANTRRRNGHRECRACGRIRANAYYARRKEAQAA